MIKNADIVIDLQAGDTGKGKVSHHLAKNYTYHAVLRYNGGGNAGHTIYHNGKKIVTHSVPVGIFYDIPSVIGPGCVVNIEKLNAEISMLRDHGFTGDVFVDHRVHVTTDQHIHEDENSGGKIGTTKQGIGPTYRDKMARTGQRIVDYVNPFYNDELFELVDVYEYFYDTQRSIPFNVLCEGAQGFQLDIDWGDYPYVTSSTCTSAAVAMNGVAPRYWRNIYGVMKAYETYSGNKTHFVDEKEYSQYSEIFEQIQNIGEEYGATTGRKRQVRWMNLDETIKAMYINNVTDVIINKVDVLDDVGFWAVNFKNELYTFNSSNAFKTFVTETIKWEYHHKLQSIVWSTNKEGL